MKKILLFCVALAPMFSLAWGEDYRLVANYQITKDTARADIHKDSIELHITAILHDSKSNGKGVPGQVKEGPAKEAEIKVWEKDYAKARTYKADRKGQLVIMVPKGRQYVLVQKASFNSVNMYHQFVGGHEMHVKFTLDNERRMMTRKPAIYLYPEQETSFFLSPEPVGDFTFVYPELRKELAAPRYMLRSRTSDTTLAGKCKIYGKIMLASTGEGVKATLHYDTGIKDIKTNGKGEYEIIAKPNEYTFSAKKSGYYTSRAHGLDPQANEVLHLDFYLSKEDPDRIVTKKPAIYLYPEDQEEFELKADPQGTIEYSYPEYRQGWQGTAYPDGRIEIENKAYDYLFWEGLQSPELLAPTMNDGFIVPKEETVEFLEEKLSRLGFNAREMNDFITYWAPELIRHPYNHVKFLVNEDYERVSTNYVSPTPDTEIRVFMLFKPLEGPELIPEQDLPQLTRSGFTLVEWGGGEVPKQSFGF